VNSFVSYGNLKPAFIGSLAVVFGFLLDAGRKGEDPVTLRSVEDLIELSDSGIWGEEPIDAIADFRVIRVSDFKGDFQLNLNKAPQRTIPESKREKFRLSPGDLLIVKSSGSATHVVSGRVAMFEQADQNSYAASNFLLRLRPKREYDPLYLTYALGSPPIREQIADSVKTMTYPNLPYKLYRTLSVPIVPLRDQRQIGRFFKAYFEERELPDLPAYLADQRRIVSRIEELAAKVEEARNLRESSHSETDALVAAEANRAVSEAQARGWPEVSLGDVAEIRSGVTLGRRLRGPTVRLPYLRVANVQDGHLDLSVIKEVEILASEVQKWRLMPGDVLLTEGGDWDKLGRGTVWRDEIPNCIHQNHIFRVRTNPSEFDPDFVAAIIGSPYGKTYFQAASKQTTNLASINQRQLKAFRLFRPPLEAQRRFIEQLSTLRAKMDDLTKLQSGTSTELDALMPSILSKAFRGEL
jgi:type I restriction enzyme, S subunit